MEQTINNNVVYVEKLDNEPGIYVIYNKSKRGIYIGQAKNLKLRALQHVKQLFSNDDNRKLNEDFNQNDGDKFYIRKLESLKEAEILDYKESVYYCAADEYVKESKFQQLYNIACLERNLENVDKSVREAEIKQAKENIRNILSIKMRGMSRFTAENLKMQDWISKQTAEELKFDNVSLKKMFDEKEIEFLIFAKAGDYIGNKESQKIKQILINKKEDLERNKVGDNSRCLWITSGPNMLVFQKYIRAFKDIYKNKKLFILFKFTVSKYKQDKKDEVNFYYEKDGKAYVATGGIENYNKQKIYKKKAFLINKFYLVNEYFDFEELQKKYYRANLPVFDKREGVNDYVLNSDNWSRLTSYPGVAKSLLMEEGDDDVKKLVGLLDKEYLLEELKEKNKNIDSFPDSYDDEHAVYYMLAEIEDYVEVKSKKSEK